MTIVKAKINGQWVSLASGGAEDEVWIGPSAPTGSHELWFDTDEPSASNADRWNSAWGIVAVGAFTAANIAVPVGLTEFTTRIPFKAITGRRYRMVLQVRIVSTTSGTGLNFFPNGPSYFGGSWDTWATVEGNWDPLRTEALFTGNDVTGSFYWTVNNAGTGPVTFYLDTMSCFYIEDCGPISYGTPPATDPTPAAVAWTPATMLNNWTSPGGITEMSVGYRKIGDICYLKGSLQVGASVPTVGSVAFMVPSGYFNSVLTRLSLVAFNSAGTCYPARADLTNSGQFVIANIGGMTLSSGAFIQLMGVNWPVGTT